MSLLRSPRAIPFLVYPRPPPHRPPCNILKTLRAQTARSPAPFPRRQPFPPTAHVTAAFHRQQPFLVPGARFLSGGGDADIAKGRVDEEGLPLWGFARRGEALERHKRQHERQNPNMMVWITGNTIDLLRLNREDLEAGAHMVYEHLVSTWEKASVEAWRQEGNADTISKGLSEEFMAQAADMQERGLTPRVEMSEVEARIVYVLWLPDALSVNFHPQNYTKSFLGRIMQRIDWRISVTSAFVGFMRKLLMGGDTAVTVHMLAHVHGTERVVFVNRQGEEVGGGGGGQRFDHMIALEAQVQWKDVVAPVPVAVEAAGPGGEPAGPAPPEAGPPLHWVVKDMNSHLIYHGRRVQFSIKLPDDEQI